MTPDQAITFNRIILLAILVISLYFIFKRPWPCPDCRKTNGAERPCAKHRDGRFGGHRKRARVDWLKLAIYLSSIAIAVHVLWSLVEYVLELI